MSKPAKPTQEELYQQYYLLVHLISHTLTKQFELPAHVAADVAQAGFLGLMRSLKPSYTHTPSLTKTCIRNASRNAIRGESRHRARFLAGLPEESSLPTTDLQAIDNRLDVTTLLCKLPAQQKQILELTYLKELSDEEAASQLHLTLTALRTEKVAALAALRSTL